MNHIDKYIKYKRKYSNLNLFKTSIRKSMDSHIGGGSPKYTYNVSEPWFTLILLGLKTVEGRKNKGDFKEMKIGDIIKWTNSDFGSRSVLTKIIEKETYDTFEKYLKSEDLEKCLPGIKSIDNGVDVYYKYYTKEDEKKYGVVAIRLELINQNDEDIVQEHILPIQNPSDCPTFTYIKERIKKVEGRKYTKKYQEYKKGDILIFTCEGEKLKTKIKDIRLYGSLEDYIDQEGYDKVLPCTKSRSEAIKIYNRWSKESERNELKEKYGYAFMAIEIEIV